jgi:dienelactone hydrolase
MLHVRLFTLIAAAVLGAGIVGAARAAEHSEAVQFQSVSYADFRRVFRPDAPPTPATVKATLTFPDTAAERYPAVIVVHTIGGYHDANEGWQAAQLRKVGFATRTYDSFASRGMSAASVIALREGPPLASGVADAYAALAMLARHPRIDAERIAILGFSFGGEVAHLAAFARVRSAIAPGQRRFAAHVAYYPGGTYGAMAEGGAYTGAPILMLLGEKDDNLPVAKMTDYLNYARAAGYPAPIEIIVYPGAYHAWTGATPGRPRFDPQFVSTRKCPLILFGAGPPSFLVDGKEVPFDPAALARCLAEGAGYTLAFDATVRAKSTADAVAFLRQHLSP